MTTFTAGPAALPCSAEALFAFLGDLSKHRAFLEPEAQGFEGDADRHRYSVQLLGTALPLELVAKERVAPSLVSIEPGAAKLFPHVLRFEIAPAAGGCALRLVDEAELPAMMAMLGADRLIQAQLETALARIQALAEQGAIQA